MAIGTRLRRLSEQITKDAGHIYQLYQVGLQPRWFPVFYVLSHEDEMTITNIANSIGHTHVSVSQIVKSMVHKGLLAEKRDKHDGRKTVVSLTKKGRDEARKIQDQYKDVGQTVEMMFAQTTHDLWKAMEEWEHLLEQKSLLKRVMEQKKIREQPEIEFVPYSRKYKKAFKDLNIEWIKDYFEVEEADLRILDNPEGYVINKGGHIVMALYKNRPVGTCALIKMENGTFELSKMAVSPSVRGKGIGYLLGQHMIKMAKKMGAKALYLESNTILKPAIQLYYKLGFQKVSRRPSPYARCNIQMELSFSSRTKNIVDA